jgi:hypothetical protein
MGSEAQAKRGWSVGTDASPPRTPAPGPGRAASALRVQVPLEEGQGERPVHFPIVDVMPYAGQFGVDHFHPGLLRPWRAGATARPG